MRFPILLCYASTYCRKDSSGMPFSSFVIAFLMISMTSKKIFFWCLSWVWGKKMLYGVRSGEYEAFFFQNEVIPLGQELFYAPQTQSHYFSDIHNAVGVIYSPSRQGYFSLWSTFLYHFISSQFHLHFPRPTIVCILLCRILISGFDSILVHSEVSWKLPETKTNWRNDEFTSGKKKEKEKVRHVVAGEKYLTLYYWVSGPVSVREVLFLRRLRTC